MADLGLQDVLTIAQTMGIIGTMLLTLYFSKKQIQGITIDVETRVLNDLNEKIHRMGELLIEHPQMLMKISTRDSPNLPEELVFSYYVLYICSHAYRMRERKILSDNEWAGWLAWMKNVFRFGNIGDDWKSEEMESWFDPAFREFINKQIVPSIHVE